jgi:alkanesulfonate monooxygenase SsuD/methylene tetrahydromethanopterin reductase-like flavin-dependent oxidoreductase (luciferase family)
MRIGLTLPNRGVLFGATTASLMLDQAEEADASGLVESVWVGDSLLGKPRLESIVLLGALAGRTSRVRLGTACMASFVLRDPILLAYQWASLDLVSGGRTVLVACTGIIEQAGGRVEDRLYGVDKGDRVRRLIEWIEIIKRLWTEDAVSYTGQYYSFENITIEPKPAATPRPPIWIANNAKGDKAVIEQTHRRVVNRADGWQTSLSDLDDLAWRIDDIRTKAAEAGRDPASIELHAYHNINIATDRATALDESKRFIDRYYTTDVALERAATWTAAGTPEECVEHLHRLAEIGFDETTVRITSWDQAGQFRRFIDEVLPLYRERYGPTASGGSAPVARPV